MNASIAGLLLTIIALLLPVFIIGLVELCKSLSLINSDRALITVMLLGLITGLIAYFAQGLLTAYPWVVYLIGGLYFALGASKIYDEWVDR